MGQLFQHKRRWYVAIPVPDKPRKLLHVLRLYQVRPLKLGWFFSSLRRAARSALRSA